MHMVYDKKEISTHCKKSLKIVIVAFYDYMFVMSYVYFENICIRSLYLFVVDFLLASNANLSRISSIGFVLNSIAFSVDEGAKG